MHRSSSVVPIDETLRALDDLIRAGKIRYISGSMFQGWKIVESLWVAKELGLNRFISEQPGYHMLDRTAKREVIPAVSTFGMAIITWGPLCGGLLAGKYRKDAGPSDGRWQDGKDNAKREVTPLAWELIDLLRGMADEKQCSVSQLALAWCAAQPGVTAPIIAPRTLQVTDNLAATEVRLEANDFERIDVLVPPCSAEISYYDRAMGLDLRPHGHRNLI